MNHFTKYLAGFSFLLSVIAVLAFTARGQTGVATNSTLHPPFASPQKTQSPAQPPTPASAPAITVKPTITLKAGDLGGRFFGAIPPAARTHHCYIAAEPVKWQYADSTSEPVCGPTAAPAKSPGPGDNKLRYFEYADETFTQRVKKDAALGILGPVLRGVVGDYIEVTFLNRTTRPLSMHPHGVRYDKDSEGAYYQPKPGLGAAVGPNARFTYVWQLNESSGPGPNEPSSKAWLYHSHVSGDDESAMGLIGLIIVTDPKRARPDGTPADVDREFASLFMIFNEAGLSAAAREAAEHQNGGGPKNFREWAQGQMLQELANRYAINGKTFCSLPGLEANEGERVRWYLCALGSEQDFHTPHWHGLTVLDESKRRTDVIDLLPADMKVADMIADNPGTWLFHCHVSEHMQGGMMARFVVHGKDKPLDQMSSQPFLGLNK